MKVIIRGSSISSGVGVTRSYVDILNDVGIEFGATIINQSRPGDTSFDAIRTYATEIYTHAPDVLILHFGIDDAYFPVYRSEFKENLVQVVRLSKKDGIRNIALMTSHPFENKYEMDTMEIYYRTIREVAYDLSCHLIPVHIFWIGHLAENNEKSNNLLLHDYRLPNDKGHEVYASALRAYINRIKDQFHERNN